jgi:hypothetical protein
VSIQPPSLSDADAGRDGARRDWLIEREAEEMANAAAALRASAERLPSSSRIGRELGAWASRLSFAAQIHGLLDDNDDED